MERRGVEEGHIPKCSGDPTGRCGCRCNALQHIQMAKAAGLLDAEEGAGLGLGRARALHAASSASITSTAGTPANGVNGSGARGLRVCARPMPVRLQMCSTGWLGSVCTAHLHAPVHRSPHHMVRMHARHVPMHGHACACMAGWLWQHGLAGDALTKTSIYLTPADTLYCA